MTFVNPKPVFEARKDFGASAYKGLIVVSMLFAVMTNPFAVLQMARPPNKDKLGDPSLILTIAVLSDIGLIASVIMLSRAKRRQRESTPVIRISDKRIQFGPDLKDNIPWNQVATMSEQIKRRNRVIETATLAVKPVEGRPVSIDLKQLDHTPEQIAVAAKAAFRAFRGVVVRDLKDFAATMTCPRCGNPTDGLKSIQSGIMIFLLFYVRYTLNTYICCRSCARRQLAIDSLINVITCNIAWPILWLGAVIVPQSGKILFSGHDKKALEKVA
jgi:hypothetical protein